MSTDTLRILFTSETGIKFFDYELTPQHCTVKYSIKKLNKKIIRKQLEKIFRLVLLRYGDLNNYQPKTTDSLHQFVLTSKKEYVVYTTDADCRELQKIETFSSKNKKKININFEEKKKGIFDAVFIQYLTFKFDITLKQIER